MRKWSLRLAIFALALMAVLWFFGRPVAEHIVSERIEAKAAQAGADIQWGPVQIEGLGVVVPDIRFQRQGIRMQVKQLTVQTNVRTAFGSPDWISAIEIRHPKLQLDWSKREKAEERAAVESVRKTSRRFIPQRMPKIDFVEPSIEIVAPNGRDRLQVTSDLFRVRPVSAGHRLGGLVRIESSRLGEFAINVSGLLNVEEESFEFMLQPQDGRKSLLSITLGSISLEVGQVALRGFPGQKSGSIEVNDIRLSMGRFKVEMNALSLVFKDGRLKVRGDGGSVIATKKKDGRSNSSSSQATQKRPRLVALPEQIGLLFEKGLIVEWANFSAHLPWLPRVTQGHLSIQDQRLDLVATVGGGRFVFESDWDDRWTAIQRGRLQMKGFQLAPLFAQRLPALPPGRSKNNRIDGGIDVDAQFVVADIDGNLAQEPDVLFRVGVNWKDGRIDAGSVSPDPVTNINIFAQLDGVWVGQNDQVKGRGHFAMGAVDMTAKINVLDVRTTPLVKVRVDGKKTTCDDAYSSLPTGILGPYEKLKLSGYFKPYVRFRLPVKNPKLLLLRFKGFVRSCEVKALNANSSVFPPVVGLGRGRLKLDDVTWLNETFVFRVKEGVDDGQKIYVGPGVESYIPLDELPGHVGGAAYLSEEINFYKNRPLDPGLIGRALALNLDKGRFVYGGSTVTQQLVKNLFLVRAKSLARKIREIAIANRITHVVSRKRVLELYLNCIEYGPNVFGIGPAAQYYFQKDARKLTPLESVFLAMMKPAPRWGAGMIRRGRTPKIPYWDFRAKQILDRLVKAKYITEIEAEKQRPYALRWKDGAYIDRNNSPSMSTTP